MQPGLDGAVKVRLCQTGEEYRCSREESLLQGMLRLGRGGIPVGCVNGGCGICKIHIVRGEWRHTGHVSREHVRVDEERCGTTLACRVAPQTDVEIQVVGRMQKGFLSRFTAARC